MKKHVSWLRFFSTGVGVLAMAAFVYAFFVLFQLRPKMVAFDSLSAFESALLTGVGLALLVILAFLLLSLWSLVRFIRYAEGLSTFSLVLIVGGVLSLVFIFSDFALLGDIYKQYSHGLSQPEWALVFPILTGQFLVTALLVYLHTTGYFTKHQVDPVLMDAHTFLVVHYVGVISGSLGLALSLLGLVYPGHWSVYVHTIIASLILLFPYLLALIYWVVANLQQPGRELWDEKQRQDLGNAALLTLTVTLILMLVLFILNLGQLGEALSRQWLPIYLFSCVFLFSLGNLYFSRRS